jgi:F-box/TPR repeat protein Pof3
LSPAKSIDPLTVLPVELAEMVLEYLAFRNLVTCMRTSRGWKNYIAKLPRLWMHLDLSGARRPVSRSFINQAVRRSEYRLTKATIHRFEHVDILKNVAKVCKSLSDLEFISLPHAMSSTLIDIVQYAPNLKRFVIHPEISPDTATQLLRHRPNLEHVGFSAVKLSNRPAKWIGPFPALKSFSLDMVINGSTSTQMRIDSLFTQTPVLNSLTLTNMHVGLADFTLLPLTSLALRRVSFTSGRLPKFPASLQKLVIEYEGSLMLRGNEFTLLAAYLPALTHLSMLEFDGLSADRLEEFLDTWVEGAGHAEVNHVLKDAAPLQSLAVRGVLREPTDGLFKDTGSLLGRSPRILTPALQSLDISTLPCNDDEIEHLLTHKTGLTSIDLSCTQITGASIKMLADKLPKLKMIRADNCPRISGRDAIKYATKKGISVSCSMGEGKGGRKIRYGWAAGRNA